MRLGVTASPESFRLFGNALQQQSLLNPATELLEFCPFALKECCSQVSCNLARYFVTSVLLSRPPPKRQKNRCPRLPTSLPLLEVPPSCSQPPTPGPSCSQTGHPQEEEEEPMPPAPFELPEEFISSLSPASTALPPLEDIFPGSPTPDPEPLPSTVSEEFISQLSPASTVLPPLEDIFPGFNADESGFSFDPKSRKVVAFKGAKTVYALSSNTRMQVTVLAALSAAGMYLPPLMIHPYKRIPVLLEGFPDALLQVSDNGWITSAIFYSWLRDSFIPATKNLKKPVLLLVDGHVSHKSMIETSQICEDHGILLYCLLVHSSHLIQPLDQAFFGSIKSTWSTATRRHTADTGEAVGLDTFAKVFQPVWKTSATDSIAASSFRAAGIFPFSPERVLSSAKLDPAQSFRDDVPFDTDAAPIPAQSLPSSSSNPEDNPLPSQDQGIISASQPPSPPQIPPHIPPPTSNIDDDTLSLPDNDCSFDLDQSFSCQPPSSPHVPAQSQPSTSSNPDDNPLPSQHHDESILLASQPPSPSHIPAPTSNDDDVLSLLDNAGDACPLETNKSLPCQPPSSHPSTIPTIHLLKS